MSHSPSILAALRSVVPHRPLRFYEALRIADLQAARLRELLNIETDEFPDEAIEAIPRITVAPELTLPVSGLTQWHNGGWVIATNLTEPWTRQRFSLAHELFHVINHGNGDRLHPSNPARAEQLADYFAGCLLMPKALMKRYSGRGENAIDLSERFGVSLAAINVRLVQLGIAESRGRCLPPTTSFRSATRPYPHRGEIAA